MPTPPLETTDPAIPTLTSLISDYVTWTIHEGSVLTAERGPVLGTYGLPSHVRPVHVRPLPLDDGRSVDVIDFFDSGTTRIVGATLRDPVETDGISTAATDTPSP
jgi:hypothetical protein